MASFMKNLKLQNEPEKALVATAPDASPSDTESDEAPPTPGRRDDAPVDYEEYEDVVDLRGACHELDAALKEAQDRNAEHELTIAKLTNQRDVAIRQRDFAEAVIEGHETKEAKHNALIAKHNELMAKLRSQVVYYQSTQPIADLLELSEENELLRGAQKDKKSDPKPAPQPVYCDFERCAAANMPPHVKNSCGSGCLFQPLFDKAEGLLLQISDDCAKTPRVNSLVHQALNFLDTLTENTIELLKEKTDDQLFIVFRVVVSTYRKHRKGGATIGQIFTKLKAVVTMLFNKEQEMIADAEAMKRDDDDSTDDDENETVDEERLKSELKEAVKCMLHDRMLKGARKPPKATTAKKKKGSGSKLHQTAKATPMAQQWYAKRPRDEVTGVTDNMIVAKPADDVGTTTPAPASEGDTAVKDTEMSGAEPAQPSEQKAAALDARMGGAGTGVSFHIKKKARTSVQK